MKIKHCKPLFAIILASAMLLGILALGAQAIALGSQPALNQGEIVTFGAYPQSLVTDPGLISSLNALGPLNIQGPQDFPELGGWKYVPLGSDWFRFEPIEWRVLTKDANEVYLLADKVLDAHAFGVLGPNDESYWDWPLGIAPIAFGFDINDLSLWCDYTGSALLANMFPINSMIPINYPPAAWISQIFRPAQSKLGATIAVFLWEITASWLPGIGALSLNNDSIDKNLQSLANTAFDAYGLGTSQSRAACPTEFAVSAKVYTDGTNARWWVENKDPSYGGSGGMIDIASNVGAAVDYDGSLYPSGFKANTYDQRVGMRPTLQLNPAVFDNMPAITYHDGATTEARDVRFGEPVFAAEKPTRAGYTFKGWAKTQGASKPDYQPGDLIAPLIYGYEYMRDGAWGFPQDLYAVWEKTIYQFNFYPGFGEDVIHTRNFHDQAFYLNSLRVSYPEYFDRDGYVFLGWDEDEYAAAATYPPSGTLNINGPADFYAVWGFFLKDVERFDYTNDVMISPVSAFPPGARMDINVYSFEYTLNGPRMVDIMGYDINFLDSNNNKVQPDGPVTVRLTIPAYFLAQGGKPEDLKVMYGNDVLPSTLNVEENYIEFQTDHFSEYKLVWQPSTPITATTTAPPTTSAIAPPTTTAQPLTASITPPTTAAQTPTTAAAPPTTTKQPPATTKQPPATTDAKSDDSGFSITVPALKWWQRLLHWILRWLLFGWIWMS